MSGATVVIYDSGPVIARGVEDGDGRVRPGPAVESRARTPQLEGGIAPVIDGVADGKTGDVSAHGLDHTSRLVARDNGEAPPVELSGEDGKLGTDAHPRPQSPDADVVLAHRCGHDIRQPEHPVRLGYKSRAGQAFRTSHPNTPSHLPL